MADRTIEERKEAIYEISEAIAPSWERRRAFVEEVVAPVREWMLQQLAPEPGQTVLEVAAGTGDTGFEAAAAVGEHGHLISTDFSPKMVDAARRRGEELGVTNVEYRVVDAAQTELDEDSVDGVLCRFGYMLMPDPAAALAEARRVLRPGGRLALAVWGALDRNPFFSTAVVALLERGALQPPNPEEPGPFSLADAEQVRALVEGTGFENVRIDEVQVVFTVPDVEEYLAVTADTAGPIGLALQHLSESDREALTATIRAAMEPFAVEGRYDLPGVALCAVAT